jgi:nicotinamidase-related amidase
LALRLTPEDTVLMVVDVQARLCAVMPAEALDRLQTNLGHLLCLAHRLEVPVVVTEQYPKGLGPTLDALSAQLPPDAQVLEKTHFSALAEPTVARALEALGRSTILLTGMEAHICVFQTARDLLGAGYRVQVAADAVTSRTEANRQAGLTLCQLAGAVPTVTEAAVFDLLGEGRGPIFKEISRRLR